MKNVTKIVIAIVTFVTGLLAASPMLAKSVSDVLTSFVSAHPTVAVIVAAVSAILSLVHNPQKPASN